MGIDISHRFKRKVVRRDPSSDDVYLRLMVKLYKFLARRTHSKFNSIIKRRLCMSRTNRAPLSLSRLARQMKKPGREGKIAVVVGTVTDDIRMREVPKLMVCALRITAGARSRILKAGGKVMTIDQLAQKAPLGKGTVLLQGPRKAREACRHFGLAPGVPNSHTKPYVVSKSRERTNAHRA
nr:60S ribosomal protein L18 [Hymenolepis microstoma]